jgi:tetrahydromethanopterin S-methyltransferase subunit C
MSDGPEWFEPKRYGLGTGRPISWQGWALMIGFVVLVIGISVRLKDRFPQMIAALIPLTAVYLVISAKTTRGGWRWRWGNDD